MAERIAIGWELCGNPSKKARIPSWTDALEEMRPRNFESCFIVGSSP